MAKIFKDEMAYIHEALAKGKSIRSIALKLGVSHTAIAKILKKEKEDNTKKNSDDLLNDLCVLKADDEEVVIPPVSELRQQLDEIEAQNKAIIDSYGLLEQQKDGLFKADYVSPAEQEELLIDELEEEGQEFDYFDSDGKQITKEEWHKLYDKK